MLKNAKAGKPVNQDDIPCQVATGAAKPTPVPAGDFSYSAVVLRNSLPTNIRFSDSLDVLKRKIKTVSFIFAFELQHSVFL